MSTVHRPVVNQKIGMNNRYQNRLRFTLGVHNRIFCPASLPIYLYFHKLYISYNYRCRKASQESVDRFGTLEGKITKMLSVMEDQRKKPPSMQTVESLHNKVDKVVRLLSDVVENQKKNAKIIHQLQKANEAQAQKEQEEIEKVQTFQLIVTKGVNTIILVAINLRIS